MQENVSLKPYNTFGLEARARHFIELHDEGELQQLWESGALKRDDLLILGGGSNILLCNDFNGLVVLNRLKGITVVEETEEEVVLEVASGEIWHDLVMHCVDRGWAGIENLSLIPGTVGAAPMQNIGAYGVEIREVLESVRFLSLEDGKIHTYNNQACRFGYRESVFKHELKGKVFILGIRIRLKKQGYTLNTSYGAIRETLEQWGITEPGLADVSRAVIHIRQSKLPDPAELGNSGSFFKNPEIPSGQYDKLKSQYPDIPGYPLAGDLVKVPAGWLIEQSGWKGKRVGNTGSHARQALVLVNYGEASGEEIRNLAMQIIADIENRFGIRLNPEVNFISA